MREGFEVGVFIFTTAIVVAWVFYEMEIVAAVLAGIVAWMVYMVAQVFAG